MQYYYEIEEAWRLYVEQGVVKAESLNPSLLRLWEISKMSGADYHKTNLALSSYPNFKSAISFSTKIDRYAYLENMSLYLIDSASYVHDVCGVSYHNISIAIGSKVEIENVGYTALAISMKDKKIAHLNYSENFVAALHPYETLCYPIMISNRNYYIYAISNKKHLKEKFDYNLIEIIEEMIFSFTKPQDLNLYNTRDYIPLFEVNLDGIIQKRMSNTNYNKYFEVGYDLRERFSLFHLEDLLKGAKQFIASKNEKNKIFLLSPIKWISNYSIMCQAEELEGSYRPFSEVGFQSAKRLYYRGLPKDIEKRIRALSEGDYSSFIIYEDSRHLSFILSLVESYQVYENLVLDYTEDAELVYELCADTSIRRKVYKHDIIPTCYHILCDGITDNEIPELSAQLLSAIKTRNGDYKLIFYINKRCISELRLLLTSETSMLDMQSLNFSSPDLCHFVEEYYKQRVECDNYHDMLNLEAQDQNKLRVKMREISYPDEEVKTKKLSYSIKDLEKQGIIDALVAASYNLSETSKRLGISRASLYRKLKLYGIEVKK